jgi:hypothetical protein
MKKQKAKKRAAHSVNNEGFFQKKWILGPLYTRSQGQKRLGANFEHFWVAKWPQVSNKC